MSSWRKTESAGCSREAPRITRSARTRGENGILAAPNLWQKPCRSPCLTFGRKAPRSDKDLVKGFEKGRDEGLMFRSLRNNLALGSEQLPQDIRQDAAVLVIIDLNRSIDATGHRNSFSFAVGARDLESQILLWLEC